MPLHDVELHELLDQPLFSEISDDHVVEDHDVEDHDVDDHEVESHGAPRTSCSPVTRSSWPSWFRSAWTWNRPRLPSSVPAPSDRTNPPFAQSPLLMLEKAPDRVDEPRPAPRPVLGGPEGASHQDALHSARSEGRVRLVQQRGHAGDDRGGLGGAGPLEVVAIDDGVRMEGVDRAPGVAGRHDRGAGRDEVGLEEPVLGDPAARERSDLVVLAVDRLIQVGRSHRDHEGIVAGLVDRARARGSRPRRRR